MNTERIDRIIDNHGANPGSLIQVLLEIQNENNWLPKVVLNRVGERLRVPLSRILHVTTFYKAFSLSPKGRHQVHVCTGTACHVRGAERILDQIQEVTGLNPGETDPHLNYSVETVSCIGCCALGPVMEVDGKIHGKVSPTQVTEMLQVKN